MTGAGFVTALLDPAHAPPAGLRDPHGRPAGKRFDVYRNNVAASLIAALETGFPVIRALLGAGTFRSLASRYLRLHPPRSPVMMLYGQDMPAFLARIAPLRKYPYLADVARLELLIRESYHAGDGTPIDTADLQALPTERLMAARLGLAPALRLLRSDWPVHAIWQRNQPEGGPLPGPGAEDVVILRPAFDPEPRPLPAGGAAFIAALRSGAPFGTALDRATHESHDFNLSAVLTLLVQGRAITGILQEETP